MAEKNIQMQRKKADGTYDLHFPLTKVENVAGAAKNDDLVAHKAETMPHRFVDNGKTYRWGFRTLNGQPQFIYEEVVG